MSELEEKLGAVLNNPQLMQQIMSMAQAMGTPQSQSQPPVQEAPAPVIPDFDPTMLKRLSGMAGQASIDKNQQALLKALGPYLAKDRIGRLERAMRAAKMAKLASSFLGQGGLLSQSGR